jgi:hypothetical protein
LCTIIVNRPHVVGKKCLAGEQIFVDKRDALYGKLTIPSEQQKEVDDRLEKYLIEHPSNKKRMCQKMINVDDANSTFNTINWYDFFVYMYQVNKWFKIKHQ